MENKNLTVEEFAHFKVLVVFACIIIIMNFFVPKNPITVFIIVVCTGVYVYEQIWMLRSSYRIRNKEVEIDEWDLRKGTERPK